MASINTPVRAHAHTHMQTYTYKGIIPDTPSRYLISHFSGGLWFPGTQVETRDHCQHFSFFYNLTIMQIKCVLHGAFNHFISLGHLFNRLSIDITSTHSSPGPAEGALPDLSFAINSTFHLVFLFSKTFNAFRSLNIRQSSVPGTLNLYLLNSPCITILAYSTLLVSPTVQR